MGKHRAVPVVGRVFGGQLAGAGQGFDHRWHFLIKEEQILVHADLTMFVKAAWLFFLQLVVIEDVATRHFRFEPGDAALNAVDGLLAPPLVAVERLLAVEDVDHGDKGARAIGSRPRFQHGCHIAKEFGRSDRPLQAFPIGKKLVTPAKKGGHQQVTLIQFALDGGDGSLQVSGGSSVLSWLALGAIEGAVYGFHFTGSFTIASQKDRRRIISQGLYNYGATLDNCPLLAQRGEAWYSRIAGQPWQIVMAPVVDTADLVTAFIAQWYRLLCRLQEKLMPIAPYVRRLIAGGCLVVAALALFQSGYAQSSLDCTTTVIVQPGDTLSLIAGRQVGSQVTYQAIVAATNDKAAVDSSYTAITNPNTLTVGWKLCIPATNRAVSNLVSNGASNVQSLPVATPSTAVAAAPTPTATPLIWLKPPTLDLPLAEMHPLMVDYMRRQSYPGSDLVVEETLAPGANYSRYIVSYRSEGYKIYALLTVPQGTKPATGWPVIIFNHGFIPPEIYRTTERYVAYVDGFARNGYIVFRSDYRGHGFSEGEPTSSRGSPAYTIDVLNAVAAMKRYGDADPARIGMWGHSMGGLLTLRSMVTTKDVKVGVIWAGVVASYPDLYNQRNPQPNSQPVDPATAQRRRWREEIVEKWGTPEEAPDIWAAISPNAYLSEISGPLQLHHGTADSDVPVRYSQTLDRQMQAVGQTVEYYEYPGDNHNLSVNFNTAMARSIAFFDQYLK